MLPGGIHPLPKPPLARLVGAAGVVVAYDIVEIFPGMYGRRAVLPHHLFPFLVIRRRLRPGQVPDVQHNIPLERWTAIGTALFGLQDRIARLRRLARARSVPTCASLPPQLERFSFYTRTSLALVAEKSLWDLVEQAQVLEAGSVSGLLGHPFSTLAPDVLRLRSKNPLHCFLFRSERSSRPCELRQRCKLNNSDGTPSSRSRTAV